MKDRDGCKTKVTLKVTVVVGIADQYRDPTQWTKQRGSLLRSTTSLQTRDVISLRNIKALFNETTVCLKKTNKREHKCTGSSSAESLEFFLCFFFNESL